MMVLSSPGIRKCTEVFYLSIYKLLTSQYEQEKSMALTRRDDSLHLPLSEWNPPAELLTVEQRVMLCGPSKFAHTKDILSIEDAHTGRSVDYRTASSETSM